MRTRLQKKGGRTLSGPNKGRARRESGGARKGEGRTWEGTGGARAPSSDPPNDKQLEGEGPVKEVCGQ